VEVGEKSSSASKQERKGARERETHTLGGES